MLVYFQILIFGYLIKMRQIIKSSWIKVHFHINIKSFIIYLSLSKFLYFIQQSSIIFLFYKYIYIKFKFISLKAFFYYI